MPEPEAHPDLDQTRRVAMVAIGAGVGITALKFAAFWVTDSMSVLSDAVESIANIVAAVVMLTAIHHASRPPDADHPYGHGNAEFMAVGLEGVLIMLAAVAIAASTIYRWVTAQGAEPLDLGLVLVAAVSLLSGLLAWYVWQAGRRYDNATLRADAKHLSTDVMTTAVVLLGLLLVRVTGAGWIDSVLALGLSVMIAVMGFRLAKEGYDGLMGRADPDDDRVIHGILREQQRRGRIRGYHKVRHRHTGPFHWVDLHLQLEGGQTIAEGHEVASEIEGEIERALGQANATAHVEPE